MAKRQIDKAIEKIDQEIDALQEKTQQQLTVLRAARIRLVQEREEQDAKRKPKRPDVQPMLDAATNG